MGHILEKTVEGYGNDADRIHHQEMVDNVPNDCYTSCHHYKMQDFKVPPRPSNWNATGANGTNFTLATTTPDYGPSLENVGGYDYAICTPAECEELQKYGDPMMQRHGKRDYHTQTRLEERRRRRLQIQERRRLQGVADCLTINSVEYCP